MTNIKIEIGDLIVAGLGYHQFSALVIDVNGKEIKVRHISEGRVKIVAWVTSTIIQYVKEQRGWKLHKKKQINSMSK